MSCCQEKQMTVYWKHENRCSQSKKSHHLRRPKTVKRETCRLAPVSLSPGKDHSNDRRLWYQIPALRTRLRKDHAMGSILIVSHEHRLPTPVEYNWGNHTLIITHDYGSPDAFERAAPQVDEAEAAVSRESEQHENDLVILDHNETYNLYQCLHTLLF